MRCLARYGPLMLATLTLGCSSAANQPAPLPPSTAPSTTTTTVHLLGVECHDAQGIPYRAESCPKVKRP